ncbi:phosphodiesterase [Curvibacter sp. APW13]|uniref:HD-GYP domain-containing protein n=1 Tax=Curvibacter sp. APW13 TaxID=3077236 RepID=UPI0028DF607B|nr:HD domain-containing phosphohydrolase [Curvibacter sp. APW13]MDT8990877.1 phosphodiesterase [Curvibacter sp. APW13]
MRDEAEYEDLLANWADLELGLGVILSSPHRAQEFLARVHQYDRWMQGLLDRETDLGLYQLFQLASNSPVGYSASHALICGALCHLMARDLGLDSSARDSLVHAALTMNIAMTRLQDELALQKEKLSPEQQEAIRTHSVKGAMMLGALGVRDENWLDIVAHHHDGEPGVKSAGSAQGTPPQAAILKAVDRYAAMISPRHTRAGRSALDSIKSILGLGATVNDPIGESLVRSVGLYPPGTYVALNTAELAVVVRRSPRPNQPFVVLISNPQGELLPAPRLHDPAASGTQIRASLAAAQMDLHINHAHILRLGAYAARLR